MDWLTLEDFLQKQMPTYNSPKSPPNLNILKFFVILKSFLSLHNKTKATEFGKGSKFNSTM